MVGNNDADVGMGKGKKWLVGAVAVAMLSAGVGAWHFLARENLPQTAASSLDMDVAGVWRSTETNVVYMIDRQEDDYLLSVSGRRLSVEAVDADESRGQVILTLRNEAGLKAIWTLSVLGEGEQLLLGQDGFVSEQLISERQLTDADRKRLMQMLPLKKPLWSPGFDCSRAMSDVERMICTDKSLAAQDARVGEYFTKNSLEDRERQKVWLAKVRDVCIDIDCLKKAYEERLLVLQDGAEQNYEFDDGKDYSGGEYGDESYDDDAAPAADVAPATESAAAPAAEPAGR